MYKYKTRDGSTGGVVPNVGQIDDNGEILSSVVLENPNLELIDDNAELPEPPKEVPHVPPPAPISGVQAERPNTVIDAHPVETPNNGEQI